MNAGEFNEICLKKLDLTDNNLKNFTWDYDKIKGCIVIIGVQTLSLETTTLPLTPEVDKFNDDEHKEDLKAKDDDNRKVDHYPEGEQAPKFTWKKLYLVLIVVASVMASGIVLFLIVITCLKVRARRTARFIPYVSYVVHRQ